MKSFEELQRGLGDALAANRPGSGIEHVVVALPSFSVGDSLLAHYADRIPSLEHRYLCAMLTLHRIPSCTMVFVASQAPGDEVLDYYASLGPPDGRPSVREGLHVLEVPDQSGRSVAAKLLDRPDLIQRLHEMVGDRPAVIEPWNVTETEVELAERLGIPINGTAPALRSVGFKSEGRRLFRSAGVPVPVGVEDLCTPAEVVAAVAELRQQRPTAMGAILKLDDSGAGDGNVVLDLRQPDVSAAVHGLPQWYLTDLRAGGVLEERITGRRFTSPSAQIDVLPDGEVRVLATHEQVLGGADGQVYMGCTFPAEPAYASEIARHALATGHALAQRGVVGRAAVDFAAARDARGHWSVHALEVNVRKGGTTHPYAALRSLVPGRYDAEAGTWNADAGGTRAYSATDNLVNPDWLGAPPADVIAAVADAGLEFDHGTGRGVVLHMLSGLAIDGRLGLTAIGHDPADAAQLYEAAAHTIDATARR